MKKNPEEFVDEYYKGLLTRLRDIRASEKNAYFKFFELLSNAVDYDSKAFQLRKMKVPIEGVKDAKTVDAAMKRFCSAMFNWAELLAQHHIPMTVGAINKAADVWGKEEQERISQGFYGKLCIQAAFTVKDADGGQYAMLPESLRLFEQTHVVLKIEDMDRLVETFSSRDEHYKRAYQIVAELDCKVMTFVGENRFPVLVDISYKDSGSALFEFSHFELDTRDPDLRCRTLFVVYRYDTTAS